MFGRRQGSRYESGKQLKRTRKNNLIALAIIGTIAYILYRSVLGPGEDETPLPLENMRNEYDRQVDMIKSEIRTKGGNLRYLEVDSRHRSKDYDNEGLQIQRHSEKAKEESEERDLVVNDDTMKAYDKWRTDDAVSNKTYNKQVGKENLTKEARSVEGRATQQITTNTSMPRVPMSKSNTYSNKSGNHTNNIIVPKDIVGTHISKHNNSNINMTVPHVVNTVKVDTTVDLLTELNASRPLSYTSPSAISLYQDDDTEIQGECVPMSVRGGRTYDGTVVKTTTTNICIHNVTEDRFVSGILKQHGTWEQGDVDGMGAILRNHSDMVLVDVGCNIGAYSLYAAKLGNKVIAIDPFKNHLKLLHKSLKLNKQEHAVTVLWNAVSNRHQQVKLSQTQAQNLGSVNIMIRNPTRNVSDYSVQTITLDDLVVKFNLNMTRIFLKMDIEASEYNALMGGVNLFKQANVCVVLMEFVSYKVNDKGGEILTFMKSFGLYPYGDLRLQSRLDEKGVQLKDYPLNTVFAKDTPACTC